MNTSATSPGFVAVVIDPAFGLGLASDERCWTVETDSTASSLAALAKLDAELRPRWVWWGRETTQLLAEELVPLDRCWDVQAVHRLLYGGWRASSAEAWAVVHGLSVDSIPQMGQLGLLDIPVDEGDPEQPVRPDGHLRPEWTSGGWRSTPHRLTQWASLALEAARLQQEQFSDLPDPARAESTARSESAAELLCAEMAATGLPLDVPQALRLIEGAAGPRPTSYADEDAIRAVRDQVVLSHLGAQLSLNLRNPADVKTMLNHAGFDLPDTKAWRLEELRESSPLINAFLRWRKAERIATTYGYRWLDEHVHDGRLRGDWSSSDGAAGRMTASAGLHNLPTVMRPIVRADDGFVFVRADLGQIEPRVLAAVSGDDAFISAAQGDDLYQPVADRLRVSRAIAKLAVLGAMYGATTGESANALAGLKTNFPVAMGMLERAAEAGKRGDDVFTSGGRRIRMWSAPPSDENPGSGPATDPAGGSADRIEQAQSDAASRGRYARNAMIQGAAAEFFKVWAITVRRQIRPFNARIVLCLHDELLVHSPADAAEKVAEIVGNAVNEAAHYWSPDKRVRYLADVSVIHRWSEAK